MKKYIILLSIVVILIACPLTCSAEGEVDEYISEFEEALPEDMKGFADSDCIADRFSLKGLLCEIVSYLNGERGRISGFFLTLLGGTVMSSVASNCHESFSEQTSSAVGVIISVMIFPPISRALYEISDTVMQMTDFFAALTPIAVGMTALGGGVSSATVQAGGMYASFSLVGGVGARVFSLLASFGLASALLTALGNSSVKGISRGIKSVFNWGIGIFTTTVTAVFSLQTLVASAGDSAAIRAARYAASGLIPVVGSAVSGAIATLAAGLSYAKTLVGAGAIAVILSLVISPLVMLLLYRLALSVASLLSDTVGATAVSEIFNAYRFALDMTVALFVLTAVIYLFQIILFLRIGASLV